MTAAATTSLTAYEKSLAILKTAKARTDPLAALIGLLVRREDVPVAGSQETVTSAELSEMLYEVFSKVAPFDLDLGKEAYLDLFSGVKTRGSNDWRNAWGTQKGLGCFATPTELKQDSFRHASRDQCVHRQWHGDEFSCDIAGSTCKSKKQAAGEVTKGLRVIQSSGKYGYQSVPLDKADFEKLIDEPGKLPVVPLMTAIYSGAGHPSFRRNQSVITTGRFLADLGISPTTAAAVFDLDFASEGNHEVIRMSEAYLLASLRGRLVNGGFTISLPDLINFHLSLKTRAFVILSGISGTGKSLLPRLYAEHIGGQGSQENLEVVPIRPGWNDLADLMGYYNALHQGFEPGPAVPAIAKAVNGADKHGVLASFLVLDELNLARVEHYFADFLSVMESRRIRDGEWQTDPLHLVANKSGLVNYVGVASPKTPFVDGVPAGLAVPDNLFIVGTVNIDESTQGISSKVLDRANTIEFEDVTLQPSAMAALPDDDAAVDMHLLSHHLCNRSYRTFGSVRDAHSELVTETLKKLEALLGALRPFRLHFGLRTRDEVCAYVAYAEDLIVSAAENGIELEGFDRSDAFDRQVLQKVLPRISGTREELQHTSRGNLFDHLSQVLTPLNCPRSIAKLARMREQEIVNFWEA